MLTNKNLLCKKSILGVLLAAILLLPGVVFAGDVVIDADFGSVKLGSSSTSSVTVIAPPPMPITITGFSLVKGTSSNFKVLTNIPAGGITLAPNDLFKIEIMFTPSAVGPASDKLMIGSADPIFFTGIVNLTGVGVEADKTLKAGGVKDILEFFDGAVTSGSLQGKGHGKSAKNNLATLRKMISSAEDMIEKNQLEAACQKLRAIFNKTGGRDSKKGAQDFVKGDAAEQLADMIMERIQELGCK